MSVRQLIIDGTIVPVWANFDLTQSIDKVEAVYQSRKKNGGLVQRTLYTGKYITRIKGGGPAPSGLDDLDTSNPVVISCIKSIGKNSASNVISIPANRRSDPGSEPIGFAVVGGAMVGTAVSMAVDVATLTVVPGATAYQVRWFPELTVICDPVAETLDRGSQYRWTIEANEV